MANRQYHPQMNQSPQTWKDCLAMLFFFMGALHIYSKMRSQNESSV
ncbi:MAG: hypothetical protein RIE73_20255 [Coleofasciculus sp. C1-SOL-03]